MTTNNIILGAGCFWGVEAVFRGIKGVANVTCGYAGGHASYPSYQNVCNDGTGHAEVVQVEYDPTIVSFESLLEVFWSCHNPTTPNRQGPDVGTQYRSVIICGTTEEEAIARQSRDLAQQSGRWPDPVVTEILLAAQFYPAEDYHQRYLEKHGFHYG
jgi:peptide-methionine (S)-S-oxide reductase